MGEKNEHIREAREKAAQRLRHCKERTDGKYVTHTEARKEVDKLARAWERKFEKGKV